MYELLFATASHGHPVSVSMGVTVFFSFLLVAMIVALALEEKLHAKKSVIVGVFAVVCLLFAAILGILPEKNGSYFLEVSEHIKLPVYIPAIDWGVMAIIFGSSLFVDITSKSGLFTWIAIKLTKASKGDPMRLLIFYGLMTVAFSAVLNNVTAMIIVGSLTGVSLHKLQRDDKLLGFLLVEALLTNVGGLLTLISSVPNIILGNAAGISFFKFFLIAGPFVLLATTLTLWLGAKMFGIHPLHNEEEQQAAIQHVESFDENDGIESVFFFWFSSVMTLLFIVCLASTSWIPYIKGLGMGYVALLFAAIMLIRYKDKAHQLYEATDWDLLGFFAALFVIIYVMEHAQVLALIGSGLARVTALGQILGSGLLLFSTALFSSVTDNIPLAAMLAKILQQMKIPTDSPYWWSVIFGCNLGGNLTPIGSASTLVAVTIIHRYKIPLSFGRFVRYALPFAGIQIALATAYLLIFLR